MHYGLWRTKYSTVLVSALTFRVSTPTVKILPKRNRESWSQSCKMHEILSTLRVPGLVGGERTDIVMLWFIAATKICIIFSHAGFFQCRWMATRPAMLCLAAMLSRGFDSVDNWLLTVSWIIFFFFFYILWFKYSLWKIMNLVSAM